MRWDWLVLANAAYFAFTVVRYWFQVWSIREVPGVTSLFFFLTILVDNFLLFLIAASSLPDAEDLTDGPTDLRDFQRASHRYLWTLFFLYSLVWAAHGIYFAWYFQGFINPYVLAVFIIPVALGALLALARRREIQVLLFAALIAQELWWIVQSGY